MYLCQKKKLSAKVNSDQVLTSKLLDNWHIIFVSCNANLYDERK